MSNTALTVVKQVDWIMAALVNPDEDATRYISGQPWESGATVEVPQGAADRFVGGRSNSGYQQIKLENNRWDESDKILCYSQTVTMSAVYLLSDTESQVIYRIDYTFIHESDVHEKIFEYSGVIEKSDSEYLIQSLGGAKKISDTTTDD